MPIKLGKDIKGPYYYVHNVKTKYYYKKNNKRSRTIAHNKALKLLRAVEISKRRQY